MEVSPKQKTLAILQDTLSYTFSFKTCCKQVNWIILFLNIIQPYQYSIGI